MSCSFGLSEIYRCGNKSIIYLQTDPTKSLLFVISANVKYDTDSKFHFEIGDDIEISIWHFNQGFSRLCTHTMICKEVGSICSLLYSQKQNKICLGFGSEIIFLLLQWENKKISSVNSLFDALNLNDDGEDFPYSPILISLKTSKRIKLPVKSLMMVKYESYIFIGAQDGTIMNISWTGEILQKWVIPQVHSVFRTASSMLLIVTQTTDLLNIIPLPVSSLKKFIDKPAISPPLSTTNTNTNSIEVSEDEFDTFQNSIHYDSIELGEELDDEDDIDELLDDEVEDRDAESSQHSPPPAPVMTNCEYIELLSIVVSLYDDGSLVILQLQDKDSIIQSPGSTTSHQQKNDIHHTTYNCLCSNRMHVILPAVTLLPSPMKDTENKKPKWIADTVSRFVNVKVLNELQESFNINNSTSSQQLQTEVDTGTSFAALVLTPTPSSNTEKKSTSPQTWTTNESFSLSLLIIRVTSVSKINTAWSGGMSRTLNLQSNCSIKVDSALLKSNLTSISSLHTLRVPTGVLIMVALKDCVKVYHVSAQETSCSFISVITNNTNTTVNSSINSTLVVDKNRSPDSTTGNTTLSTITNNSGTTTTSTTAGHPAKFLENNIQIVILKKHIVLSSPFILYTPLTSSVPSSTMMTTNNNSLLLLVPILLNPKSSLTPTATNLLLDINENSDISTILLYSTLESGITTTTHYKNIYSHQNNSYLPTSDVDDDDDDNAEKVYEQTVQEIIGKFLRIPLPARLVYQVKSTNAYRNLLLNNNNTTTNNSNNNNNQCNKNDILITQSNRYIICVTEEVKPIQSEKMSAGWESAVMLWILDRQGQGKWKSMVLPNSIIPLRILPVVNVSPQKNYPPTKLPGEVNKSGPSNSSFSIPQGDMVASQDKVKHGLRPTEISDSASHQKPPPSAQSAAYDPNTNNHTTTTTATTTATSESPQSPPLEHVSPWKQLAGCTATKEIEKPPKISPTSDVLGHAENVVGLTNFGCHSILLITIRRSSLHPTNGSLSQSHNNSTVNLLEVVSREQSKNTLVWKSAEYRQVVGTPQASAAVVLPDSLTPTYLDVVLLPGSMSVTIPDSAGNKTKEQQIPLHRTNQRNSSSSSHLGQRQEGVSQPASQAPHPHQKYFEEDHMTVRNESEISDSRHSSNAPYPEDSSWSNNDYSYAYSQTGNDEIEDDDGSVSQSHSYNKTTSVNSPRGDSRRHIHYDTSSSLASSPYRPRSISSQDSSSHSASTSTFYHLEKSRADHHAAMSRPPVPTPSTTSTTTTASKKRPKAISIPKDINKGTVSCVVVVGGNNMMFLCFQITAIFELSSSTTTAPSATTSPTAIGTPMSLQNNKIIPKEYKIDHLWSIDQTSTLSMVNDISVDLLWPLRSVAIIPIFRSTKSSSNSSNSHHDTNRSPYSNYYYNNYNQSLSEVHHHHHHHHNSSTTSATDTTTNHENIITTISLYVLDGLGKLFLLSPPILPAMNTVTTLSPPSHHRPSPLQQDPIISVDYFTDHIASIERCQNSNDLPLSLQYVLVTYPDIISSYNKTSSSSSTSFTPTPPPQKMIHLASLPELGIFVGPAMSHNNKYTSQNNEPSFHEEYFGALGNEGGTLILSLQCSPLHLSKSTAPTPNPSILLDGGSVGIHCESLIIYIIDALLNSVMHSYVNHDDQISHHSTSLHSVSSTTTTATGAHQPLDVTGLLKALLSTVRKKPRESQLLVQCLERKWRGMVEDAVKSPETLTHSESILKYALLSSLLFSCDELLLIEVLSRLGRKVEPESRQYLFPLPSIDRVHSSDISMNKQYEYIDSPWTPLALYELCLSRCRLHHAARLLTLACEAGGGAVNRSSSATSLVLALELLALSLSHLSLRIAKECLDFCLRLELLSGRRIHQHQRREDGTRPTLLSHSSHSHQTATTIKTTTDQNNIIIDDDDDEDITADDFGRQNWKNESTGWGDGWLSSLSSVVTSALSLYPGYQSAAAVTSQPANERPKVSTLCPSESTRQWTTALAIEHQLGAGGFAGLLCDGSGSATLMAVALLSCDMLSSRRFHTASMVVLSVMQSSSSSHAIIHQLISALQTPLLRHKSSITSESPGARGDSEVRQQQQQQDGVEAEVAHILEAFRSLRLHKAMVSLVDDVLTTVLSPTALRQRCESELLQHQLGGKRRSSSITSSTPSLSHQSNSGHGHGDDTTKPTVDNYYSGTSNNLLSSSETFANYFELPHDFLRSHTQNARKGLRDPSLIEGISLRTIVKGLILSTAMVGDWSLCVLLLMLLGRCDLAASCVNASNNSNSSNSNNNNNNNNNNNSNSNNSYLIAKTLYKFCCHESQNNNNYNNNNMEESEGGVILDNLSALSDNPLTVQLQGIILSRKSLKVSELISSTCQMLQTFRSK